MSCCELTGAGVSGTKDACEMIGLIERNTEPRSRNGTDRDVFPVAYIVSVSYQDAARIFESSLQDELLRGVEGLWKVVNRLGCLPVLFPRQESFVLVQKQYLCKMSSTVRCSICNSPVGILLV